MLSTAILFLGFGAVALYLFSVNIVPWIDGRRAGATQSWAQTVCMIVALVVIVIAILIWLNVIQAGTTWLR